MSDRLIAATWGQVSRAGVYQGSDTAMPSLVPCHQLSIAWATVCTPPHTHTHTSADKVTLAVGVMNGHTVMKWRHQGGWREDRVWRTGRPHVAATRRIAQRPGAVKGEITHLLCLFLTATAPIHHHWGRDGTQRPISNMNYGTEKH